MLVVAEVGGGLMDTPEATLMIYTEVKSFSKEGLAVYCAAVMGRMGLDMESVSAKKCGVLWGLGLEDLGMVYRRGG